MNLNKLGNYLTFDHVSFLEGKVLKLVSIKYDEKNNIVKGELGIVKDPKDENEFGKIGFKIEGSKPADVNKYELKSCYTITGVVKAVVYGDLRDNLSITCKGLNKVIEK